MTITFVESEFFPPRPFVWHWRVHGFFAQLDTDCLPRIIVWVPLCGRLQIALSSRPIVYRVSVMCPVRPVSEKKRGLNLFLK